MTRIARYPLALLLAGALMAAPATAMAHDELIGTSPEDGSSAEAPEELTLTFSGQISSVGATVQVTDEDGEEITDGDVKVEGTEVVQDLVDDLPDGDYAVAWRVTSEDGHPIAGELGFAVVGAAEEPEESATEETTSAEATSEEATAEETEDNAAAPTSAESTTQAQESAAEEPSAESTTEAESTQDSSEASTQAESSGLPVWAWAFIIIAIVGLGATLAVMWSRARRSS